MITEPNPQFQAQFDDHNYQSHDRLHRWVDLHHPQALSETQPQDGFQLFFHPNNLPLPIRPASPPPVLNNRFNIYAHPSEIAEVPGPAPIIAAPQTHVTRIFVDPKSTNYHNIRDKAREMIRAHIINVDALPSQAERKVIISSAVREAERQILGESEVLLTSCAAF